MTSADTHQAPEGASSAGTAFLKLLGGVALWLFAAFTFTTLPISVMASDGCTTGDTGMICTVAGQNAVFWTPGLASPAAALLGTWGLASRRENGPMAWMTALMMLMATWFVVLSIAR
ncbi:hypothetical protein ACH4PU_26575 [Streptomyces sp. NPDC021100]|uniref:hypothetical protein n=1 Tax=Streptomyces sp. NPDC021100 TaxID=3365114 RepID=UPI0037887F1C